MKVNCEAMCLDYCTFVSSSRPFRLTQLLRRVARQEIPAAVLPDFFQLYGARIWREAMADFPSKVPDEPAE